MTHELFWFWFFWNFKLVPIDLELNSAMGNQTHFYQKCGSCTQKSNETWNLKIRVKIKKKKKKKRKKNAIERLQMESGGTKILVYARPQDSWL